MKQPGKGSNFLWKQENQKFHEKLDTVSSICHRGLAERTKRSGR
jgi:hypothetical protein